ncbi:MAG: methylase [Alphaproteobacteria bacterium]|nr:methylase [Alphaproteobacteria bacterium]
MTAPGRLALLDAALLAKERALLEARSGVLRDADVIDLGLGTEPWTTLELRAALDTLDPPPPLLGVDSDPERVQAALPHAQPGLRFACGGLRQAPARLIRAMNLLRAFSPEEAEAARALLGAALLPGGLLIEGTSNREGSILTAWWLRKHPEGLRREGLLLAADGRAGFAPRMFLRWLPRDLRAEGQTAPEARALLDRWTQAWAATEGDPLARMRASAAALGASLPTPSAAWFPWDAAENARP